MFMLGLSFTCPGGIHMFTLFNESAPSWNLLLLAFIEVVVVGWIYGAGRLLKNLEEMEMKIHPVMKIYWLVCWKFTTPLVLLALVIFSWINFGHVKYEEYTYPTAIQILGYFITGCTLIWIPILTIIEIMKKGRNELYPLLHPTSEWGRGPPVSYGCVEGQTEERTRAGEKAENANDEKIPLQEITNF